jgi:hypothetical protein
MLLYLSKTFHLNFNKVKPIKARNATRSRVATSYRCFCISATKLSLPLFRLTSHRVCAGAARLLFVLEECLCSFGDNFKVLPPTTRLYNRHQRTHIHQVRLRPSPPSLSPPSLNFPVLVVTPFFECTTDFTDVRSRARGRRSSRCQRAPRRAGYLLALRPKSK